MNKGRQENEGSDELQACIAFTLGNSEFAIPLLNVKEVIPMFQMTLLPEPKEYIQGVIHHRGAIVSVFDLERRLGVVGGGFGAESAIVVLETPFSCFGIRVDQVNRVCEIRTRSEHPPFLFLDFEKTLSVHRLR